MTEKIVHKVRDDMMLEQMTDEQWRAIRKEAGLKIDSETAEVEWIYAQTLDPYGLNPNILEEYWQVGREYFAGSPESYIWIWFGDLPDGIRDALWEKHKRRLAFPAGTNSQQHKEVKHLAKSHLRLVAPATAK